MYMFSPSEPPSRGHTTAPVVVCSFCCILEYRILRDDSRSARVHFVLLWETLQQPITFLWNPMMHHSMQDVIRCWHSNIICLKITLQQNRKNSLCIVRAVLHALAALNAPHSRVHQRLPRNTFYFALPTERHKSSSILPCWLCLISP